MHQITVGDITYTFSEHAETRMAEEEASLVQVEETMLDPDRMEPSRTSGHKVYIKMFRGHKRSLMVVADEENKRIVTAYWIRSLR